MEAINIAIDGPAGSGKTTVGKLVAQKLNYRFLDSGLLYRHFAHFCHSKHYLINILNKEEINKISNVLWQWQKLIEDKEKLIFDLEKERSLLNSQKISDLASQLAPLPELRKIILDFQRELTKSKGWVVVGRDITSEVLFDAEIKIFLTASLDERVKRRYNQHSQKVNYSEIEKKLKERDERDEKREISPLKKTTDSWELDTTFLSPLESVEEILNIVKNWYNRKK